MRKASLYWHTVKYLKPIQIYGRLWFKYYSPKPDLRPSLKRSLPTINLESPARRQSSVTKSKVFRFLNTEGSLENIGWNGPQKDKLWRYNQHYFDDLNAILSDTRLIWHKELIEIWITENPPGEGVGWDPYPTSLRIVNWVKWYMRYPSVTTSFLQSLAIQARWLEKRLE